MGAYADCGQPAEAAKSPNMSPRRHRTTSARSSISPRSTSRPNSSTRPPPSREAARGGSAHRRPRLRNAVHPLPELDGKEKEAISVINEGLEKGVLKPDHQAYVALAQAYYFADQAGPAIDAYKKAAPLAPDGETYLNLAKALGKEGRFAESKQAAQQALDKGVKKPDDAKKFMLAR